MRELLIDPKLPLKEPVLSLLCRKNKSMQRITLTIKDDKKVGFLLELLKQFEFIEVQKTSKKKNSKYNFFASAGLWKDRDIDSKQLRKDAWTRNH